MQQLEKAYAPTRVLTMMRGCHTRPAMFFTFFGARSLPSSEAVEALRPFLNTMRSRASGIDVLADASADAVGALVQRLEATGVATNDLWEEAIEASLSFAETAFKAHRTPEG
jgi:hypothetical protein